MMVDLVEFIQGDETSHMTPAPLFDGTREFGILSPLSIFEESEWWNCGFKDCCRQENVRRKPNCTAEQSDIQCYRIDTAR